MNAIIRDFLVGCAISICGIVSAMGQGTMAAFDNFGPNNSFHTGGAAGIVTPQLRIGFAFRPAITGTFRTTEMPLFWASGANAAEVALCRHDPESGGPGEPLELFRPTGTIPPPRNPDFSWNPVTTFSSNLDPMLFSGEQYWLTVGVSDDAYVLWYANLNQTQGLGYLSDGSGAELRTFIMSAFRITVTPVPEPRIASLLAISLIGLLVRKRPA